VSPWLSPIRSQTALRDVIGKTMLLDMLEGRDKIGSVLQKIIEMVSSLEHATGRQTSSPNKLWEIGSKTGEARSLSPD
jgi:hypothetical protein